MDVKARTTWFAASFLMLVGVIEIMSSDSMLVCNSVWLGQRRRAGSVRHINMRHPMSSPLGKNGGAFVVCFVAVTSFFVVRSLAAQEPEDASAHDKKVMSEVRRQVEALPKDKQIVVGTEIQRAALNKLKTEWARQRALASLGDLYAAQGELQDSAEFYRKAIEVNPVTELATYSRLKAAAVLRKTGQIEDADQLVDELHAVTTGRDGKLALDENVVSVKVDAMISEGQLEKAVSYCADLSRQFPSSRSILLHYSGRVPIALKRKGDHEAAVTWYSKIFKAFDDASMDSSFVCNYISALRYCDPTCTAEQLERLRLAIEEFAASFPGDLNVPVFFATYADSCRTKGQDESARTYYKKAMGHPKVSEEVKQAITRMLGAIESDQVRRERTGSTGSRVGSGRWILITGNAFAIAALMCWLAHRKWRGSAKVTTDAHHHK